MSARARRMKMQEMRLNKVIWPLDSKTELLPQCPQEKKIPENVISKDGLQKFQVEVNECIEFTKKTTAPQRLQWGGQVVALIIVIIGVVCLTQDDYIVVGVALMILGFLFSLVAFWYRQQLLNKSWKRIGLGLNPIFKQMSDEYPGVSYEFHVQGIHTRKNHKGKVERSTVRFHRYLVLYLPGDQSHYHDYVEDRRSVAEIVHGDSKAKKQETDIVGEELTLPYWWATGKTRDGKTYYINNLKHRTQWNPPTQDQIEIEREELNEVLAPPNADRDDFSDSEDEESS